MNEGIIDPRNERQGFMNSTIYPEKNRLSKMEDIISNCDEMIYYIKWINHYLDIYSDELIERFVEYFKKRNCHEMFLPPIIGRNLATKEDFIIRTSPVTVLLMDKLPSDKEVNRISYCMVTNFLVNWRKDNCRFLTKEQLEEQHRDTRFKITRDYNPKDPNYFSHNISWSGKLKYSDDPEMQECYVTYASGNPLNYLISQLNDSDSVKGVYAKLNRSNIVALVVPYKDPNYKKGLYFEIVEALIQGRQARGLPTIIYFIGTEKEFRNMGFDERMYPSDSFFNFVEFNFNEEYEAIEEKKDGITKEKKETKIKKSKKTVKIDDTSESNSL